MNQRIRELAIEAGLEMCSCGCDMPTRQSAKFAELIVQECMEVCRRGKYDGRDDMSLIQFNNGIRYCINAIDEHFGD